MTAMKERILNDSALFKDEAVKLRRHFHMYPELSFHEFNTAAYIAEYLELHGISFRKGIAGNGIIGRIDGKLKGGRVVAVRAEMDALPVNEVNDNEYRSTVPGVMHACGHDANLAALLCAARILHRNRNEFGGTILLIFQPGEEKAPGGASQILASGELSNPKPDIILGQHALPELETGKAGFKPGIYMASSDEVYITIKGKGGHAALTALITDQVFIASKLIVKLKDKISERQGIKKDPTVFSVGKISGEGATNVIPEKVEMAGTLRTFSEDWRKEAKQIIRDISSQMAAESGVTIEVSFVDGYPVLCNNEKVTGKAVNLSADYLGKENIEIYSELRMSSDDFAYYSTLAPSLYYRYGIKEKGKTPVKLHTSGFDIDEEGLEKATGNLCWLVFNFLNEDSDTV